MPRDAPKTARSGTKVSHLQIPRISEAIGHESVADWAIISSRYNLGLTYAATTARLMGQLIAGETPDIDLHPYRVNRFQHWDRSEP